MILLSKASHQYLTSFFSKQEIIIEEISGFLPFNPLRLASFFFFIERNHICLFAHINLTVVDYVVSHQ